VGRDKRNEKGRLAATLRSFRHAFIPSRHCGVVVQEPARVVGIETAVAARAAAELARPEARVRNQEPGVEGGAARVAEARTATGARIVVVLCELEDLRRDVLSDCGREATSVTKGRPEAALRRSCRFYGSVTG
jgi:hypothetical protein